MNKIFLILLTALLISGGGLLAQDADGQLHSVETPVAPFVARAPAKSSWVIDIKPTDKGPISMGAFADLPQKYLKSQRWVKFGALMKCESEWADGTKTEDWVVGKFMIYQDPQVKKLHLLNAESNAMIHDFTTSDFLMLDWIGADDYLGAFTYANQPCYLFEAKEIADPHKGPGMGPHNKTVRQLAAPTSPTKVYISVQTKLPVAIINGDGEFKFQYLPPPQDPLVMPESVASIWKIVSGH